MPSWVRRFGILVPLILLLASSATAEDRDKAREAFQRGNQHYALGEYEAALEEFKAAYRNFEDPTFLFNIGQCERQLERRADAIRSYRMYLVNAPDASNREVVRGLIERLEHELADERAAKPPATTPAPLSVSPASPAPSAALPAQESPRVNEIHRSKPLYKRWWFWTVIGGVAAAGAATGLAIALTRPSTPTVNATFGTASPF